MLYFSYSGFWSERLLAIDVVIFNQRVILLLSIFGDF